MKLIFNIDNTNAGKSLKEFLRQNNVSTRLYNKLKRNNNIYLNNTIVKNNSIILSCNDTVKVDLSYEEESDNIVPTKIELEIMYEDDWYIIINKPPNIAIHPSMNHYADSLSNGVKYYLNEIGLNKKIRPVNRLDKDTSRTCHIC